jgi:hypothetical protein
MDPQVIAIWILGILAAIGCGTAVVLVKNKLAKDRQKYADASDALKDEGSIHFAELYDMMAQNRSRLRIRQKEDEICDIFCKPELREANRDRLLKFQLAKGIEDPDKLAIIEEAVAEHKAMALRKANQIIAAAGVEIAQPEPTKAASAATTPGA